MKITKFVNPSSKRTAVNLGKSGMTGIKMIRKVRKTPFKRKDNGMCETTTI